MLHLNVELAALRVLLLLLVTGFGVLADRVSLLDVVGVLLAVFPGSFWALVALVCVLAVAMACRLATWL